MHIEFSFETLRRLGLTPAMAQSLATADVADNIASIPLDATPPQWMRATAVHRETVEVHDGNRQCSARCAARLTRELIDEGSALAVGDWVLCKPAWASM